LCVLVYDHVRVRVDVRVCVCDVSTFLPNTLFGRLNHKGLERGQICSMHEQIRYAYEV